MKLPKYNLAYNTRDQLQSLATNASERKHINTPKGLTSSQTRSSKQGREFDSPVYPWKL